MSINSPLDQYHDFRAWAWDIQRRLKNIEKGGTGAATTGVAHIGEAIEVPGSSPTTGGGFLYVQGGALWFRGGAGTVTQIAPA
jgi:hypothetical protein